jgi:hypothetical protein
MIQNVLRNLGGVGIYGVISICLFFTFFSLALLWSLSLKKNFIKEMSDLPLRDQSKEGDHGL